MSEGKMPEGAFLAGFGAITQRADRPVYARSTYVIGSVAYAR